MPSNPLASDSRDCPSREELTAFYRGDLPKEKLERLAAHLGSCRNCVGLLSQTDGVDPLLNALRRIEGQELPEIMLEGGMITVARSVVAEVNVDIGPTTTPFAPPPRLQEYELHEQLGQGGMGMVFRATHTRLGKTVAIKLMSARHTDDARAVARFEREMRAVGQLSHPHIVQATDARVQNGIPFLVMEYIEGIDLARLVGQRGPLPIADACEVIRQSALGLQHAHEHSLIHRDIKPSNLMLTSAGQVKILDMGLALLQGSNRVPGDTTSSDHVLGTLDFMAPEQGDNPHAVDARADLYSLGCALYFLLTAQPPFPSPMYSTPLQKLKAHSLAAIPPVQRERQDVSAPLASVVSRLLAKNPADRFASAAEVATALAPFTTGCNLPALFENAASTVSRRAPVDKQKKPARVWRWLVAGLVALLLFAGVVLMFAQTNTGILEIDTDDDQVAVVVERGGREIANLAQNNPSVRLDVGEYELTLKDNAKDLQLKDNRVVVRPNQVQFATVRRFPSPAIVSKEQGPPKVVKDNTVPKPRQDPPKVVPTLKLKHTILSTSPRIDSLVFSRDGSLLAAAEGNEVTLLDAQTGKPHRQLPRNPARVTTLAYSPDGKMLAIGSAGSKIILWDTVTSKQVDTFDHAGKGITEVTFSPNGKLLASSSQSGTVAIWDLTSRKELHFLTLQGADFGVRRVVFTQDSNTLAASAFFARGIDILNGGTTGIVFWDVKTGERQSAIAYSSPIGLRLSPDGKSFAVCSWNVDKTITRFNAETRRIIAEWRTNHFRMSNLAFSHDGNLLATIGEDGTLSLWDVATEKALVIQLAHKWGCEAIAFSSDGKTLATGGTRDNAIRFWDISEFTKQPK